MKRMAGVLSIAGPMLMFWVLLLNAAHSADAPMVAQGPEPQPTVPSTTSTVMDDPLTRMERRLDLLEEWKTRVEKLPLLAGKVNFGLNALQINYTHLDAKQPEGRNQDQIFVRRSELLAYGKINEHLPKWHVLFEFQSINFANTTPTGNSATAAGGPVAGTFFRESYIDFRPVLSWAPNLNFIRMGVFRMPFGIFTETSGGLRDVISSPYLTSVGSGGISNSGTVPAAARSTTGTIEMIHERDYFFDVRGTLFSKLEYVAGIMNGNGYQANIQGPNGPKQFYWRTRYMVTDVSFVSFTGIVGESNNAGTFINGRGKGEMDRWGLDFRYTSRWLPGFMIQGEWWQGHDGANQTTVGMPANGSCGTPTICGGSGAPGVQRRTWYVLAKYYISSGPLQNWEPVVMYEQFDPNTAIGRDIYQRTIIGVNYYFENLPPKIQSKVSFDYEFRTHQGFGPGVAFTPSTDAFANNAFLMQWQIRYQ
jgi:hypothetical protein